MKNNLELLKDTLYILFNIYNIKCKMNIQPNRAVHTITHHIPKLRQEVSDPVETTQIIDEPTLYIESSGYRLEVVMKGSDYFLVPFSLYSLHEIACYLTNLFVKDSIENSVISLLNKV